MTFCRFCLRDEPVWTARAFGWFGRHVRYTDGRYIYMLPCRANRPLNEYTLMPTHMACMFQPEELRSMQQRRRLSRLRRAVR